MAPDTNAIHIDGAYAQEIVEFWVHKYHQVKTEFDQLKVRDFSNCSSTLA